MSEKHGDTQWVRCRLKRHYTSTNPPLQASLSVEQMRFPRFIFADNMEDKGIEISRAQNFQKILIERVNEYDKSNFQIIYTTSYITDELNESSLVVGEYYTNKNHSLKNIAK